MQSTDVVQFDDLAVEFDRAGDECAEGATEDGARQLGAPRPHESRKADDLTGSDEE